MKTSNRFAVLAGVAAIAFAISSASAQTTTTGSCVFNTNLKVGQRSADVINLQKVLNSNPATSIGNAGKETNFFGPATFAAVKRFQAANNITPVSGFVGALTRAALNNACSTGGSTSSTNVVNTNTPNTNTNTNTNNNNVVSNNSIPSVLVAGSARAKIADFTFNGNNIITAVKLQRTGVSNNSVFNNVYLYDGNTRVADGVGVSTDGTINWNYTGGLFQVSGSKVISVYADVALGTSGSTAGVALLGYTAQGSSPVVLSPAIAGPVLSIGAVTLANVSFQNTNTVSNTTVTAGTPGVKVWGQSVNVSSNSNGNGVNFSSLALKTIGSAPQNAFTNYVLKVDGTNVGTPSSLDNNNRVSFNFAPTLLRTGGHTIEVFADNIAGSSRTVQFTLESQGDITFVDPNVGANVAVTTSSCTQYWNISCAQAGTLTINGGQLVIQADNSFNQTTVISGVANQVIGRFVAKAYGEDEKVYSLTLAPSITGATPAGELGLKNVSLYLNGGQVGTSQNWSGSGTISFNLNSNFIIAAGATATIEIKADTFSNNNNFAYTGGTLSAGTLSGTAYGNGSNGSGASGLSTIISASSIRTLTLASAQGSLGLTGATAKSLSPSTNGVNIGSINFSAGQNEAARLNQVNFTLDTSADTNGLGLAGLTSITLYNGNDIVGQIYPTGGPASNADQQAVTLTFNPSNLIVPVNGNVTLNLVANVGNVATGFNVVTSANVQYTGNTSQANATSPQTTSVRTTFNTAVIAQPALSGNTAVEQYVVGGGTNQPGATFSLKTSTGVTNINRIKFRISGLGASAVQSIVINGSTYSVTNNVADVTFATGIPVSSSASDLVVGVNTVCFSNNSGQSSSCNTASLGANNQYQVGITDIFSDQASVAAVSGISVVGKTMSVVASKPTVTIASTQSASKLANGPSSKQLIGQVTVTADNAGNVNLNTLTFTTTGSGPSGTTWTITNAQLTDDLQGNNATVDSSGNAVGSVATVTSGTAYSFSAANGITVTANQSRTFYVFANVAFVQPAAYTGSTVGAFVVSTGVNNGANQFVWSESLTNATQQTTGKIQNFPSNTSFTVTS